jgi:transcriptional/translational regulatory protein YebC/TACO1
MVLAELLEEYNEKGKIVLEYEDDDEEEVEAEITDVSFDESDINYLTEQITDILRSLTKFKIQKILNTKKYKSLNVIYAELSGDFPLGDSRQPTYKSLRPFDLVS